MSAIDQDQALLTLLTQLDEKRIGGVGAATGSSSAASDNTSQVEEEAAEHMFFFAWTGDVFSDPTGDGNADNRADDVNYSDQDAGGLPLGLSTEWTTGDASAGTFRVVLKHQPEAPDGS